jgi:hypothetical protein
MTFAAWNVISAPKVRTATPTDQSHSFTLQHLSTQIIHISKSGCATGTAVWGATLDRDEVFVAFDWVEMRQGVAVLTDPNSIISNLSFVNDDGDEEPVLRRIVGLARLVHITPWQEVAVSEAHKQRTPRCEGRPLAPFAWPAHATPANNPVHPRHSMLRAA